MAHFAQIDKNSIVLQVIVIDNNEIHLDNGLQDEALGIQFCKSLFGKNTNWVQTSYNATIRKNYAGIGYQYDVVNDAFIAPRPFTSWILNTNSFQWEAPIAHPQDSKRYAWDEPTLSWITT
jgi:hypothetical protein